MSHTASYWLEQFLEQLGSSKIGKFKVSLAFMSREPEAYKGIMSKLDNILDARIEPLEGEIEYIAICDDFEMLEPQDRVPQYTYIQEKGKNGKFKRL